MKKEIFESCAWHLSYLMIKLNKTDKLACEAVKMKVKEILFGAHVKS